MSTRSFHNVVATAALVALLGGCSHSDGPRKITQTQTAAIAPGDYKVGATSQDRFGGSMGAAKSAASEKPAGAELAYDVPPGWKELPPVQFREVNLKPAGHADAECYVTALPGMSLGISDNVNRWRKQFGQPALDATAIAALPTQKLFTIDATLVELEGTFGGMAPPGGQAAPGKPDFALVGLLVSLGDQMVTVKLTGPKDLVRAERPNFDLFVKSLRISRAGGASGGNPHASPDANPHGDPSADPHGGEPPPSSPHSTPPVGGFEAIGMKFTAPAGWTREPDRTSRLATLKPAGAKESECAIIVMSGDAGGVSPNLRRWRGQMGLTALTPAEIEKLPKIRVLGKEAVIVDWVGRFEDPMTNRSIPQARFLAAIAILDARTVFVKLTGPEAEVDEKVRDAFLELCASLKE